MQSLREIWDCWNGDGRIDYQGKFYQFSLMTPFFNPGPSEYPPPPIFTAAINSYNCRVAGQVSDGLMLHSLNSPEYVRQVVRPNIARGAQQAQRDPSQCQRYRRGIHHHRPQPGLHPGDGGRGAAAYCLFTPPPAPTFRCWNATASRKSGNACTACPWKASGLRWAGWSTTIC